MELFWGPSVYINDLDYDIVSKLVKFADDTKLRNRADTLDNVSNIETDLNGIINWADTWQLTFNSSKCEVLHIGNANLNTDYKMRDIKLETIDTQKDLGIVIISDLKTTKHCIEVEKKYNHLLGYIKYQFQYRNKKIVVTLYNSLVLPYLQYCIQFWSPSLIKDINRLEKIQARAIKYIPEIRHLSYENRLQVLGLLTLKASRIRLNSNI